eukprot:gene37878-51144_t
MRPSRPSALSASVTISRFGAAIGDAARIWPALGAQVVPRDGGAYRTDQGNIVLDCHFAALDPVADAGRIAAIPGTLGHGLFLDEVDIAYIAVRGVVTRLERARVTETRSDARAFGRSPSKAISPMSDTATPLPTDVHEDGSLARLTIDTIRTLSMDAVQAANSGHPGTPMALAPVGYALWAKFLRTDPTRPDWPNRDRFVLSVGHASMLLYSLLHLAGVREIDRVGNPTGNAAELLDVVDAYRCVAGRIAD